MKFYKYRGSTLILAVVVNANSRIVFISMKFNDTVHRYMHNHIKTSVECFVTKYVIKALQGQSLSVRVKATRQKLTKEILTDELSLEV